MGTCKYCGQSMNDSLKLEIDYISNKFEKSTRIISDISVSEKYGIGFIDAYCHLREEMRTFNISHIEDARIVTSAKRKSARQTFNYEFDPSKPIFNLYGEEY